jgi:hypothetical protein
MRGLIPFALSVAPKARTRRMRGLIPFALSVAPKARSRRAGLRLGALCRTASLAQVKLCPSTSALRAYAQGERHPSAIASWNKQETIDALHHL